MIFNDYFVVTHLRHSLRRLSKSPAFTIIAIAMIGLGIGISTSSFSVTNAILLRPIAFPEGERLMRIFRTTPQSQSNWSSPANFFFLRSTSTSFSELAVFNWSQANVSEKGQTPEIQSGIVVTANFLTTLGVQPLLGRGFALDEDQPGRAAVLLLTNSYWKRRFAGDPGIIGRTLRVGVEDCTVIGILPDFDSSTNWYGTSFVMPEIIWPNFPTLRNAKWFDIIARLKPGVTLDGAQTELSVLAARIDHDYPADNGLDGLRVTHLAGSDVDSNAKTLYWLAVGLSTLVLLIACSNLAGLTLTRAHARVYEYAVRSALGASRFNLMALFLVESLALTLAGGVLGVLLGFWANHFISHYFWGGFPIPLDGRVLLFAFFVTLLTGISFAAAPAWIASNISTSDALKEISRGNTADSRQHRLRSILIIGQLASALVLVSSASSFGIAVSQSLKRGLGWQPSGLFSGFVSTLDRPKYKSEAQEREFAAKLRNKLSQIPGVTEVSVSSESPLYGYFIPKGIVVEGFPPVPVGREQPVLSVSVDSEYFRILGIPIRAGQQFPASVKAGDPRLVVINEAMARQYWPGQNPIGKRIRFADEDIWNEVIGVAGDVRMARNFDIPYSRIQIYRAFEQVHHDHHTFILKSVLPPESLFASARQVVAGIDPDIMLEAAGSVEGNMQNTLSEDKLIIFSLGAFATVGLLIALIGLYTVINQLTLQRGREIGIRIALGASDLAVLRLVFLQGIRLILFGLVFGLFGAYGVERIFRHAMPELHLPGASVEVMIASLLCLAGLIATYLPARAAGRIDPLVALRAE
jgi:putative ABC transport system permease protein